MSNSDNKMKTTTDIGFIGFLLYKGLEMNDYTRLDRGKVVCKFDLSEEDWKKYKLEYNNSEFIKFKNYMDQIKHLGY